MPMTRALIVIAALFVACNGDEGVFLACEVPADCSVPEGETAECLPKGNEGFCTWTCAVDDDCFDDASEVDFVCAPFESSGGRYCFPSCEGGEPCPQGFECRSTGGGADNRRICFPSEE